jgi:O-antigen ligase
LIALLILINPLFISTQKFLIFSTKILIQQVLIITLLIVYLATKEYKKFKLSFPVIIIAVYIAYLFLRTLLQPVSAFGFQQLYYLFPYALLFIIISQLHIKNIEKLFLSNSFLLSLLISIPFGLFLQNRYSTLSNFSRLQLSWANANYLASYLLVTIGFILYTWKTAKKKWIHFTALISLIAALLFLFWTQSRGGMLSLILVLLALYIIYAIKKQKKLHIIISITILILLLLSFNYVFRTIRPQTITFRERVYKANVEYIKHNWLFGSGLGTFVNEFPRYRLKDYKLLGQEDIISHAHNEFVEIWAETGIIGLALFIAFIFTLFRQYKRKIKSNDKYFIYVLAFSLVLLLIHNLFSITMRVPPILIYFFFLAGFLSADYSQNTEKKSYYLSKYILIILGLVLTICVVNQYRTIQGLAHFSKSESYYASRDSKLLPNAILEAEIAHKYIPNNTDLLYHQGLLYTISENHSSALQTYKMLERISPYYPQLHFWKGYLLSLSGAWTLSVKEYKKEIRYNEYPKVYFNLAIAYHYLADESNSMMNFMIFAEKIKLKTERHLIKDKDRIMKEEGRNLKFALDNLAKYYEGNKAMIERIDYLRQYFFTENNN